MPFPIPYTLIRTTRKTIGIRVLKDGTLEIRAPKRTPTTEIEKILYSKEKWIREHRNKILSIERTRWQYGSSVPYLGIAHTVVAAEEKKRQMTDTEIRIPADLPDAEITEAIVQLFVSCGKMYLTNETNRLAEKWGLSVHSVTVNRAAKRWGSCSVQTGRVHYSWRLMCAPKETVEYVVAHELAHLLHPDHSTAFWQQVEKWLPDYENRKITLREYENYFMGLEGL